MSKGMSIEELRKSLESDATKELDALKPENDQLKKTNKELLDLLKEKTEDIIEKSKEIGQLQNRCVALSGGLMCVYCNMRVSCPHSPGNKFLKARGYIK